MHSLFVFISFSIIVNLEEYANFKSKFSIQVQLAVDCQTSTSQSAQSASEIKVILVSYEDSYNVLYLIKVGLIKHINIQATNSADDDSHQTSTSTAEIKSTKCSEEIKSSEESKSAMSTEEIKSSEESKSAIAAEEIKSSEESKSAMTAEEIKSSEKSKSAMAAEEI